MRLGWWTGRNKDERPGSLYLLLRPPQSISTRIPGTPPPLWATPTDGSHVGILHVGAHLRGPGALSLAARLALHAPGTPQGLGRMDKSITG